MITHYRRWSRDTGKIERIAFIEADGLEPYRALQKLGVWNRDSALYHDGRWVYWV